MVGPGIQWRIMSPPNLSVRLGGTDRVPSSFCRSVGLRPFACSSDNRKCPKLCFGNFWLRPSPTLAQAILKLICVLLLSEVHIQLRIGSTAHTRGVHVGIQRMRRQHNRFRRVFLPVNRQTRVCVCVCAKNNYQPPRVASRYMRKTGNALIAAKTSRFTDKPLHRYTGCGRFADKYAWTFSEHSRQAITCELWIFKSKRYMKSCKTK